mmetsp:Transcript_7594/g.18281  ORF Transcript_7594/g.18281 Transcript_7594/m.18281 type:complete len:341 (-) Transcript_7594:28-1050(-)|eukprot:CAMPEP_0113648794 /NCGR_PEP_ID=MMETSP0017_2-20120614/25904_1 /TAXON_ID=2856 /ORGANISM="Cylindrotheca closterium" /LENGTH=340 /DNA_ID=CAMNT_0000561081 /DNA_START=98 /DNA_END=1120 /DNA_ORIENTATION=+ /assembly_acc=CAM_ASM_000147
MPSVAEELEALKKRSLTKGFAEKLKDADGLSTPEQEQATIQKTTKATRASLYKKDAVETLNAGTKAVDQDLAFKQKQIAQKKEDMQKKEEAAKNLKSFNTAKLAATPTLPKQENGSSSKAQEATPTPVPAPAKEPVAAPTATTSEEDDSGVPELEEIEEVPDLVQDAPVGMVPQNQPPSQQYVPQAPPKRVPNRAEKKAKKTVEKLGMKSVSGIARVTLKLNGNQGFYTIFQPDVYEKNGTYIVFGEAQQGAGVMDQQAQAARAAKMLDTPVPTPTAAASTTTTSTTAEVEEETAVDETGLEAKDIDLVISQAGCSRSKAVTALRENNGDLVNAIMSLTT